MLNRNAPTRPQLVGAERAGTAIPVRLERLYHSLWTGSSRGEHVGQASGPAGQVNGVPGPIADPVPERIDQVSVPDYGHVPVEPSPLPLGPIGPVDHRVQAQVLGHF